MKQMRGFTSIGSFGKMMLKNEDDVKGAIVSKFVYTNWQIEICATYGRNLT